MNPRRLHTVLFASMVSLLATHCGGDNASGDIEAPTPTSVTLSDELAGPGQTLTIHIAVSENLTSAPAVSLGVTPPRPWNALGFAAGIYEYDYMVVGDEPEGAVSVLATMTDVAGNTAADVAIASIAFDFTAPVVGNVSLGSSRFLRADVRGIISLSSDDVVRSDSTARFVNSGTLNGIALQFQRNQSVFSGFAFTPTGSEPEGATQVEFTVSDISGNQTVSGPHDAFVLDFTPPVLTQTDVTYPSVSISGADTVEVTFTANEPLKAPRVEMRPQSGGSSVTLFSTATAGTTAKDWTASRQLTESGLYSAELWTLEVSVSDLAGNQTVAALGTVTLIN